MCKKTNYKTPNTRIDKCMKQFINSLDTVMQSNFQIVACCCGHGKYPMTIIVKRNFFQEQVEYYELVSGEKIPRTKRFYKRDKQGYYYIPEVLNV